MRKIKEKLDESVNGAMRENLNRGGRHAAVLHRDCRSVKTIMVVARVSIVGVI